ncbi:MAG TPA: shikimate kinase [Pyrinomonadaceae bacterium]|nr:shikimate kinase [Pyrinomonadaceae bacterium]
MDHPVVITGFMGAGKTTVAAAVAELLRCVSVDLDAFIEEKQGRSAKDIIVIEGEAAFREIETRCLRQVLALDRPQVIALGGGAWTLKTNRDLIAAHNGFTVWLDTPFELCWQRIARTGSERPLAPNKEQARALYTERRQCYELAQLHIVADGEHDINHLAAAIARSSS